MSWIAVGALFVVAVVVITIMRKAGPSGDDDLGAVSAHWVAEHRADRRR